MRPSRSISDGVTMVVLACCILLTSSAAGAELLTFEGRLFATLPVLGETEMGSGVGVAEIDDVDLRSIQIQSAHVSGSLGVPVTDPGAVPVTSVRIVASLPPGAHLGIGPLEPSLSGPVITAPLPVPGELRVCMLIAPLPPCIGGFAMPLTKGSGTAGVGVGGLLTLGGGTATVNVSLYGAPFTLNTTFVTAETPSGDPFTLFSAGSIGGPLSFPSSAGQPGGFVSVVTPVRATAMESGADTNLLAGFLRLELRFLPEPGLALLLGAGAAGLGVLGRTRRRPEPRCHPPRSGTEGP